MAAMGISSQGQRFSWAPAPPDGMSEDMLSLNLDAPDEWPDLGLVSPVEDTKGRERAATSPRSNPKSDPGSPMSMRESEEGSAEGRSVKLSQSSMIEPSRLARGMTAEQMVAASPAKRRASLWAHTRSKAYGYVKQKILDMHTDIEYYNIVAQETVVAATRWRRWSGHALSEYDTVGRESLAERVCALDKSLSTSGLQVLLYEDIGKYLKPEAEGYEVFCTGQVLCIVALICWYLMVAKEAPVEFQIRSAGGSKRATADRMVLEALEQAMLVSVTELILNAVALGIILDIDDLLFDAMATTAGTAALWRCPTSTIASRRHDMNGFADYSGSLSGRFCLRHHARAHGQHAGDGEVHDVFGVWLPDVEDLSHFDIMSVQELLDANNPTCGDLGDKEPMLNYLRGFFGNESIQGCHDVEPYCGSITQMPGYGGDGGKGWAARMLCSKTCGCQVPGGDFISVQGCPYGYGNGDIARACWNSTFNWEFKTVEIFCPQTCSCDSSRRDSGCPRPYGLDCDALGDCLVWNDKHICPPTVPITHGTIQSWFSVTDVPYVESVWYMIQGAMIHALTQVAGIDPSTMIYWQYPQGSVVVGHFTIFQIYDTMDLDAIDSNLYNATTLADYQQHVDAALVHQGVSVEYLALQIFVVSYLVAQQRGKVSE
eukprot:Skav214536  [mRNA]  locus=scaffold410:509958:520741:+ [translate_table: standard]